MVVFLSLRSDLVGELLEVGHDERVDNLHVLVILGGQVIFHQSDFLSQQFNLLFVITHLDLRTFDYILQRHG